MAYPALCLATIPPGRSQAADGNVATPRENPFAGTVVALSPDDFALLASSVAERRCREAVGFGTFAERLPLLPELALSRMRVVGRPPGRAASIVLRPGTAVYRTVCKVVWKDGAPPIRLYILRTLRTSRGGRGEGRPSVWRYAPEGQHKRTYEYSSVAPIVS